MSKVTLIRTLNGASPADDDARRVFLKWKVGEERECDIRQGRAHKGLRRWFGLARVIAENCEQFRGNEKLVHSWLKLKAGHAVPIASVTTGEILLVPDSIAYDAVEDEKDFEEIWARATKAVLEDLLPTVSKAELEHEIMQRCGASSWYA